MGHKSHSTWNDTIIAQKCRGEPSENAQEHQSLCEIMFNDVLNALMGKHEVKSVLNLQMTYIIITHIYEQWDR